MHVPIPNSARFNSPNMFPNVPVNPIKLSPRHSKKIFLEKKDMNRVKTKKKMFVFTFNRLYVLGIQAWLELMFVIQFLMTDSISNTLA